MKVAPAILAIAVTAAASMSAFGQAQPPTFRSSVDLIAIDVQVVDRDGRPIADLKPETFSVTIDGRQRKVVSVDHVRHETGAIDAGGPALFRPGPTATNQWPASGPVARTFLLAFDTRSFNVADSRRAAQAARAFVDRLAPNDVAGVYSFPLGPRIAPTADRGPVRAALETILGAEQKASSQFHLSPTEVIDISAEAAAAPTRQPSAFGQTGARGGQVAPGLGGGAMGTFGRVLLRECGGENDLQCAQSVEREATDLALYYEAEVAREVNDLTGLIRVLSDYPGRKTVVVFSRGIPVTDRPGGRPTVGDLARVLGEEAARANASIYALYFDSTNFQTFAAETRKTDRIAVSHARESNVMSRFLDEFASTSGGTMMRVVVGSGENALSQILRETSAYYLLGVSPADADRDGRTHRMRVKVDTRDATIRSRTWVHIPKQQPARSR